MRAARFLAVQRKRRDYTGIELRSSARSIAREQKRGRQPWEPPPEAQADCA